MSKRKKRKLLDQPKEVIRRWSAIKAIRLTRKPIEDTARFILRIKLTLNERNRTIALTKALSANVKQLRKLKDSKFEGLSVFVNIAVFFLLASRDIQSIKIDALTSNDPWKRGLLLRVILLTIHEWEMPKVASANKMNAAYEAAGISVELRKQMSEALRLMNKAQEKAQRLLYNTRNAAIGHRDADALLQYETIVGLDTMKTMEIVASFYTAADMFVKTLPNLILQAGSPSSLLRQYAKNA